MLLSDYLGAAAGLGRTEKTLHLQIYKQECEDEPGMSSGLQMNKLDP